MGKALFPYLNLKCAPQHVVTSPCSLTSSGQTQFLQLGGVALRKLREKDAEFEVTLGYIRRRPSLQLTPSLQKERNQLVPQSLFVSPAAWL